MSKVFSYRPDIDGLRAIAVLLVIFYHAKFSLLSGGFIGVDVFFVLSGFLITIILYKEAEQQRFSFASFYLRRIRRLAPALVTLLLCCAAAASWLLFPNDFELFSRSMAHSFIATNNFFMWDKLGDYFSPRSDLMPLMHTWSLAVEEQFYFIWPAMFILMYKRLTPIRFIHVNTALLFIFFALSVYLTRTDSHSAYFLLPARAFELMMGALLAIVFTQLPRLSSNINHALSLLGIILVITPALLLTHESLFPGLNAFWPCLGAVLLIISGKDKERLGAVNQLLTLKPIVFIGLLSYSLYLWHWPIFAFMQYLGLELTGIERIGALALTFILSYLSWRFVEQPFRKANIPTLKIAMTRIMLPSFIVITTIYLAIDGEDGFPGRFKNLTELDKRTNAPGYVRRHCIRGLKVGNVDDCWLGVKKDNIDGMLIGDSFANHSYAFMDVFAKDADLYIHDSAAVGVPVLSNLEPKYYQPEYAQKRLEYALQFENIYLAACWDCYNGKENPNYDYIIESIGKIIDKGLTVYLIYSLQATTNQHLHQLRLSKAHENAFFHSFEKRLTRQKRGKNHLVEEILRKYPSIIEVNMNDILCDDNYCNTILDDTIIYQDHNHLNIPGSTLVAEKYLKKFGNPFKKPTQ